MAYLFNDYWEDIGTIKSFFEANLALAQQVRAPCPRIASETVSSIHRMVFYMSKVLVLLRGH